MSDDLIQRDDGKRVRDALPSEWEAIIGAVQRALGKAQTDLRLYQQAVERRERQPHNDTEELCRGAVSEYASGLRTLKSLYARAFPSTTAQ